MNIAHPNWMVQAISMAIYVQVIGAFVWLFVVMLLERHRRHERRRLAKLEEFVLGHGQTLGSVWRCIQELEKQILIVGSSGPTSPSSVSDHEQTDPAFRLPSGIEHPRITESPEVDDEPKGSLAEGHWQCVGCRRTYALCEGHHGKKCFCCGGTLELVSYEKRSRAVQLPLPVETTETK